jgi:hypothetical protein
LSSLSYHVNLNKFNDLHTKRGKYLTGGFSMSESKVCNHRFSFHEEHVGFTLNDGVDVFTSGTRFQKCITCGHMEMPVDACDLIEANQNEKRNNLFAPKNMYIALMSL